MSSAQNFIQWVKQSYQTTQEFALSIPRKVPFTENYDLIYKRKETLMKGKQWYFFKGLPPVLTLEVAQQLNWERKQMVKSKKRFFKLLQEMLIYIYVSDSMVPNELLEVLADFRRVKKSIFGNIHEICLFLDTSNGEYLKPQKIGSFGWRPVKILIKDLERYILLPYSQWIKEQH